MARLWMVLHLIDQGHMLDEELDARLSNPDIDDRTLARLTREAVAIANKVPELKGWLMSRTTVELEPTEMLQNVLVLKRPERSILSDDYQSRT